MITRNIINISNHPMLDVKRKAQIYRSHIEYDVNRVVLKVKITHHNIDGSLISYKIGENDGVAELISDNEVRVNPATGAINDNPPINPDGTYTADTIGEYDYLWMVVNVAKVKTMEELEEMYINLRMDKINKKLYGI